MKTVLNRSVFRNVKHGFVDIKKEIHLVCGAAGVWINLVPRALFLPLAHLKGKGGLDTSSQIKKEDNYDTSSCSSGLKENIVERQENVVTSFRKLNRIQSYRGSIV